MPGEGLLQTLQRVATALHRLDVQAEEIRELRATVTLGFEQLRAQIGDLRERLVRLETARDADRAQMRAELSQFMVEVERTELRLSRLSPPSDEPPLLPGEPDEER